MSKKNYDAAEQEQGISAWTPNTMTDQGHNQQDLKDQATRKETKQKLSIKEKASFGLGGFVDQVMSQTFGQLSFPIYNIALGLDAKLLGIALAVPRFVDAVTDPLVGHLSDNSKSRWGRRKPFIAVGAILMAVMLVLVFSPPLGLSQNGLFIYATITASLMYIAYTIYAVPTMALGMELTDDYHERTSLQSWRMAIIAAKMLITPWLLRACFYVGGLFPESDRPVEAVGVVYVTMILGLLMILGTIPILAFCRERKAKLVKTKVKVLESLKNTLGNKLFGVHLLTIFMVIIGAFIHAPIKLYVNIYHVYGGDKEAAATMTGIAGTLEGIIGFMAIPLITLLAKKFGKKAIYAGGILSCGLLDPLAWFLFDPDMPYLQLINVVFTVVPITCVWILNPSITADIIDYDELQTGQRREGMFTSVWGFAFKAGISGISALLGLMIAWTGFIADGATQTPETVFRMRMLLSFVPTLFLVAGGLFFLWKFSLTQKRVEEIQAELTIRHGITSEDSNE